jgi:hypothetical protein
MKKLPTTILKDYKMPIEIVKLITGEEIISETVDKEDTMLALKKPCVIQLMPSRENPEQPMMGLFPYAVYVEDHIVEVSKSQVLWRARPVKELYNQYNNVFGTGIQLAGL